MAVLLCGCTGGESRASREEPADRPAWLLESPNVTLGKGNESGEPLDRVYGGVLRDDGSIAIGNSGTSELRTYGPDGKLLRTSGRRGAGPGEFGGVNWVAELPGDSIIAFDLRQRRFSVWSPAGVFVRMFNSQATPGPVRPIGVFRDGSILIVLEGGYDPRAGAGVVRDSIRALRMSSTGQVTPMGERFPGAEWLIYEHPASFGATQLPFGRTGHLAVMGDHFAYGSSESATLTVYDTSGRPVRTIEVAAPGRTPSREEISAVLADIQDPVERNAVARLYRGGADAGVLTGLRGDDEGNLWIRTASPPGTDTVTWLVHGPAGERLGSVRMHTSWLPLDIRRNTLLLRETDTDGVQTVSVRRVAR